MQKNSDERKILLNVSKIRLVFVTLTAAVWMPKFLVLWINLEHHKHYLSLELNNSSFRIAEFKEQNYAVQFSDTIETYRRRDVLG